MSFEERVVATAKSMVGVPYKWGGGTPDGFDCTGLVSFCYTKAGLSLFHHTAEDLLTYCEEVGTISIGNLAFRRYFSSKYGRNIVDHVGIIVDQGIVSSRIGKGVVLDLGASDFNVWSRLKTGYRYPSSTDGYMGDKPLFSRIQSEHENVLRTRQGGR